MGKRKRALSNAVAAVVANAGRANALIRTALARAATSAVLAIVLQQQGAIGEAVAKDAAAQRAAGVVAGNAVRRTQQLAQAAAQAAARDAAHVVVASAVAQRDAIQRAASTAQQAAARCRPATGPAGWRQPRVSDRTHDAKPWDPEQLDVVLRFVKDNADATRLPIPPLLLKFGYGGVTDPETYRYLQQRVAFKCNEIRNRIRRGLDPLAPPRVQRNVYLYPLTTKVRQVLRALPQQQFTTEDVCNAILADAPYAATLDWRPVASRKDVPMWRKCVQHTISHHMTGAINTGVKRGSLIIYRYDPDSDLVPSRDPPQPKRRKGMPFLGKNQ